MQENIINEDYLLLLVKKNGVLDIDTIEIEKIVNESTQISHYLEMTEMMTYDNAAMGLVKL